jgi:hypothetical protein
MNPLFRAFYVAGCLSAIAIPALGADIGRLEWGDLVVESDSSNGYQEIKSSITFSALEAKADGGTTDAKSLVAGHFDITQPKLDTFNMAKVNIEGHIIKSSGSVARLVLNIGGAEQVIEWAEGTVASEKFSRSINIAMPAGGRLPSPFPVSVEAVVRKIGNADAAYVSVSGVSIAAVPDPRVAAN